jgi:hypothetical protein
MLPLDAGAPAAHHHFALESSRCTEGQVFRTACNRCLGLRESCPTCEGPADGGCLPQPICPPGAPTRNVWGVCSSNAAVESALELPMQMRLQKGVTLKPGKYVLTVNDQSFAVELREVKGAWSFKGAKQGVIAQAGAVDGLWGFQWVTGKKVVMLMLQAKSAPPYKGGFALHQPGARVVTGEVALAVPPKETQGVKPFEQLAGYLETLQ